MCETRSLALREEHKFQSFVNRVRRQNTKDERRDQLGILRNEELCGLYRSPSVVKVVKSRQLRLDGCMASMGETRIAHLILVWNLLGNLHLEGR
jgi:type II secretory pathway component PulC